MRKHLAVIFTFFFLLTVFSIAKSDETSDSGSVEIRTVLSQIQQALANVQTTLAESNLPPLSEVTLDLQTVVKVKGSGSASLWIVTVGGSLEKDKIQQIVLSLVPPKPGNPKNVAAETLTHALEQAIVSAAQGVKDANKGGVPLRPSKLSVTLQFTVEGNANGDIGTKITPITADFKGDLTKTAIQKLTVNFAFPDKK
ncbi:trypco2 family protein [Paraburkholderia sp. CI3]|uniref:trypco2 family protein n=1 Tax=Paraburkholderia sp. CI3 TaxID=2991060 RepID=UPI003D1F2588